MNTTGKKYGGRQKGTPNKITANIRETINNFIDNNILDLQAVYDKLEPKEKIHYLTKLLEFTTPKLKNVEVTDITRIENIDLNTKGVLEQINNEMLKGNTEQAEILLKTFASKKGIESLTDEQLNNELKRLTISPKDWT